MTITKHVIFCVPSVIPAFSLPEFRPVIKTAEDHHLYHFPHLHTLLAESRVIMYLARQTLRCQSVYTPLRITPLSTMNASRRSTSTASVKTFSNQTKLPRLPVPDLEKSLEGYLKSLIPLLEQKVSDIISWLTVVWSAEPAKRGRKEEVVYTRLCVEGWTRHGVTREIKR